MQAKGWWRIAVKMQTLKQLDQLKKELFPDVNDISYDKVIRKLISEYYRLKRL